MENQTPKLKYIKRDAAIDIKVGTQLLLKLQQMMVFLLLDKSEEELKDFEAKAPTLQQEDLQEDSWQYHFLTLRDLVFHLEAQAEAQGFVQEMDEAEAAKQ